MPRNNANFAPPPPSLMALPQNTLPEPELATTSGGRRATSSPSADDGAVNPSIIITILVIATAIILSATIFLLIRFISIHCHRIRRRRRSSSVEIDALASDSFPRYHSHGSASQVAPDDSSIIDSLPLFTFGSITGSKSANSGGDCAVCLSKFEPEDQLRLLPVCCHAFHADCIDAWIANNHTCPLCRSSIFLSESEVMSKVFSAAAAPNSASESFRVEIGSVSHRHLPSDSGSGNHGRSYSIGSSFDYIVDDSTSEVAVASTRRRPELASGGGDKSGRTDESEIHPVAHPGETLAAEVGTGGERWRNSWLKDYVDRMSWTPTFSLSSSFRSSGRFFVGSSRRSTDVSRVLESDLEASRLGDEISEMFRWLSGV